MTSKDVGGTGCKWGLLIALWGGGLYGALRITELPGNWGHGICGPWGCGPRLQALVACHLFWLVLLIPAGVVVGQALEVSHVRLAGTLLVGMGALAVIAVAVYEGVTWLPATPHPEYYGQRILFTIAMLVDVPIAQTLLLGLFFRRRATVRERRSEEPIEQAVVRGQS